MSITDEYKLKLEQVALLEQKKKIKEGLPHLHGFNLYKWQRAFINETKAKVNLLCSGNQVGKSSCNILKLIHWATEPSLWPKIWPNRRPRQFWFLMPTRDLITTEFRTKWEPEFLPRGEFKNHDQYGWEVEIRSRHVWALHFKTGISVYMHTYEQDVHHLQAGTVDAIFVDEEPPWEIMPELLARLISTEGPFHAVMTPTRGLEQWRRAFELKGEGEVFPGAFKQKVSVFDCLEDEHGNPTKWTMERINRLMNTLGTQQEIDLRIYGKFVAQHGLRVGSFDRSRNVKTEKVEIPADYLWYSGVDIGSGGTTGHPPAISFVAVRPDFKHGYIALVWKGESTRRWTATDILDKYVELRAGRNMAGEYYDHGSAEFGIVAARSGMSLQKAEKGHEAGFTLLNTLFKNQMLDILPSLNSEDLITELVTLRQEERKNHAVDDCVDSTRYALAKIPWSFDGISGEKLITTPKKDLTERERRLGRGQSKDERIWLPEQEIASWNSVMSLDEYDW